MSNIRQYEADAACPGPDFIRKAEHGCWINPGLAPFEEIKDDLEITIDDVRDASERLERSAPLIMALFPETEKTGGIIESELAEAPNLKKALADRYAVHLPGALCIKKDNVFIIKQNK